MRLFIRLGSKRMLFWVLLFIIFAFVTYFFGEYRILHSEPYLITQQFLMRNREVSQNVGAPPKLSLKNHKMRTIGEEGEAKFDISILGAQDNGKAMVELEEKNGIWHITRGTLFLTNGKKVELLLDSK